MGIQETLYRKSVENACEWLADPNTLILDTETTSLNGFLVAIAVINVAFGIWFGTSATIWLMHRLFPVVCVPCLQDGLISRNSRSDATCWRCGKPLAHYRLEG